MLRKFIALRIVIIYFTFASMWILFSDFLLEFFVKDINTLSTLQTYKGLLFIIITSILLLYLIKSHTAKLYKSQKEQNEIKQRLEFVIQGANLGYWDWDYNTNKQLVNDTWLKFIGLTRDDIKEDIVDWSKRIHPDDQDIAKNAINTTIKDSKPYVIEFRMLHKNGHWVWIEGSGRVVQWDKNGYPIRLAGTHKDINDRKKAEEKTSFLALNDPLTKLPNRFFLRDKIDILTDMHKNTKFIFLFLDLDYFKNVNDLYGHSQGDLIIQDVAKRFKKTMKQEDFISRVDGDEFVILKHNVDNIEEECKNIINSFNEPFIVKGNKTKLNVSIGIALFPNDGKNFEELFKNAGTAMYAAKINMKKNYLFYKKDMTDKIIQSTKLNNEIQSAIENDEFVVHFQSQIDLSTKEIIGAEALVRWEKPNVGLVFPGDFIQKAEENRAIIDIGLIVFKKSLEEIKKWQSNNLFQGKLAINISAVQLEEENFVTEIEEICKTMNVKPSDIELEITESYIMKNPEQSIEVLHTLKKLGFKISIDDFGTGYSSLSYLKKLPIHKLKIDRSFIKDLPYDKEDVSISKAIISLAKNLELEVLAEGVETIEQQEFLEKNSCDSVQGYLFSKPIDSESFYTYLSSK